MGEGEPPPGGPIPDGVQAVLLDSGSQVGGGFEEPGPNDGGPVGPVQAEDPKDTKMDLESEYYRNIQSESSSTSTRSAYSRPVNVWSYHTFPFPRDVVGISPSRQSTSSNVSNRALAGGPMDSTSTLDLDTNIRAPPVLSNDPPCILPYGQPNPFLDPNHLNRFWAVMFYQKLMGGK